MKSMTGYGEASQNIHGARITVQIRSVNHRHLDLQVRTPREYMSFEEEIRKLLREKISRGRIDLFVNRYAAKGQARKLEMDEALISQFISGVAQIKKKYKLGGEVDVALVSNIPDVFHVREVEIDSNNERQAVLKALAGALKKLELSREREGTHLRTDMESQIAHLREIAAALEARENDDPLLDHYAAGIHEGALAGEGSDAGQPILQLLVVKEPLLLLEVRDFVQFSRHNLLRKDKLLHL